VLGAPWSIDCGSLAQRRTFANEETLPVRLQPTETPSADDSLGQSLDRARVLFDKVLLLVGIATTAKYHSLHGGFSFGRLQLRNKFASP
jgi:hypothetical protein